MYYLVFNILDRLTGRFKCDIMAFNGPSKLIYMNFWGDVYNQYWGKSFLQNLTFKTILTNMRVIFVA